MLAWHVSEELLDATYKMKIKLFPLLVLREHRKVILRLSVIRAQEGETNGGTKEGKRLLSSYF